MAERAAAQVVAALDADGDGTVDIDELRDGIASGALASDVFGDATDAKQTARKVFAQFDTTRDGKLEVAELTNMVAAAATGTLQAQRKPPPPPPPAPPPLPGASFGEQVVFQLDADGDGRVSEAELRNGIASGQMSSALGPPEEAAETARKLFARFDEDHDGELDAAELTEMAERALSTGRRQDGSAMSATEHRAALLESVNPAAFAAAKSGLRSVATQDKSTPRTDAEFIGATSSRKRFGESREQWMERELRHLQPKGSFGFTADETAGARLDDLLARAKCRHPRLMEDHSYEATAEQALRRYRAEQSPQQPLVRLGDTFSPRAAPRSGNASWDPPTPLSRRRADTKARAEAEHTQREAAAAEQARAGTETAAGDEETACVLRIHQPRVYTKLHAAGSRANSARASAVQGGVRLAFDGDGTAEDAAGSPRSSELLRRANMLREQRQSLRGRSPQRDGATSPGRRSASGMESPRTPSSPTLNRALQLARDEPSSPSERVTCGRLSGRPSPASRRSHAEADRAIARRMGRRVN